MFFSYYGRFLIMVYSLLWYIPYYGIFLITYYGRFLITCYGLFLIMIMVYSLVWGTAKDFYHQPYHPTRPRKLRTAMARLRDETCAVGLL